MTDFQLPIFNRLFGGNHCRVAPQRLMPFALCLPCCVKFPVFPQARHSAKRDGGRRRAILSAEASAKTGAVYFFGCAECILGEERRLV